MLHCLALAFLFLAAVLIAFLGIYLVLRTGFSPNGKPMRFDPASETGSTKTKSWYIEGVSAAGVPISCSFLEFDERGDFLDFNQHRDSQARLKHFAKAGNLLLVICKWCSSQLLSVLSKNGERILSSFALWPSLVVAHLHASFRSNPQPAGSQ
jgi:hypothetical protein